jgi:hypothetical protein
MAVAPELSPPKPHGVRPTPIQIRQARRLIGLLAFLALLAAVPATPHFDFSTAPLWAKMAIGVALLQVAYLVWALMAPDYAALWTLACVFAAAAVLYAIAASTILFSPPGRVGLLHELTADPTVRRFAFVWCALSASTALFGGYLVGQTSQRCRSTARSS